jgi:hypothetical protein
MFRLPLLKVKLRTRNNDGNTQAWDPVRKLWVALTPEEHVRQCLLRHLIDEMQYPAALMAIERALTFGHTTLRFDVVIYHRDTMTPWMLVECKSPEVRLTDDALHQLLQYQSKLPACNYWLLTNGHAAFCADATDPTSIKWINTLPAY